MTRTAPRRSSAARRAAFIFLPLMAAAAAGCSRHSTAAPAGGSSLPPSKVNLKRNVDLARAEQRPLVYFVETVGVLEAEGMTDLAAGVKGVVDEVNFREGDLVDPKQKEPLVRIDQASYRAALDTAVANEKRAVASLGVARDRMQRAHQAGAATSEAERREAELNLSIAEAELQAARAALDLAKHNFERSQVRPPYKGRINKRMVTPGCYLEDKTVIATMADLSHIRLVGYVPESAVVIVRELMGKQEPRVQANKVALPVGAWLAGVGTGLLAELALRRGDVPSGYDPEFTVLPFPNRTFRGRIFYLSTVADPSTHMFECKAEVDMSNVNVELKPGFTARIKLPIQSTLTACVVPEESVRATERGFVVFEPESRATRSAGTPPSGPPEYVARVRPIEIGYRTPGFVEVRQGVTPGHWVVRRGADALEDGTPVRVPDEQQRLMEAK
jgi:RND family efflux transporter MFP subunit